MFRAGFPAVGQLRPFMTQSAPNDLQTVYRCPKRGFAKGGFKRKKHRFLKIVAWLKTKNLFSKST
jgi:hypothetical protein